MDDVSLFFAGLLGVAAMLVCIIITLYYTGLGRGPVHHVAESSQAGPALNLITGLSTGLGTPLLPMIAVLAAVVGSFVDYWSFSVWACDNQYWHRFCSCVHYGC